MVCEMKLLLIYNTSELRGIGNIPFYVDSIRSLLAQRVDPNVTFRVCISAHAPSQMWHIQSQNTFGNHVSYNFIPDNVPLSITFNHTVSKMIQAHGKFDHYLYIDSGISFWDPSQRHDALQKLLEIHLQGYASTAALASNDDGRQWLGWDFAANDTEYVFPVGKTTNMHCQFFCDEWRETYGHILPDIFASHTMESVFPFMAAAIKRKNAITRRIQLLHLHSLDGASAGSRNVDPDRIKCSDIFESGGLLFKTKKTMDKRYREGHALGFGWESCKPYWQHDPSCFDEHGHAKQPELKDFLKKELYLSKEEFDYSTVNHHFIP